MATYTKNYKLTKPSVDDLYDIGIHNENMNIIDSVMYQSASAVVTEDTQTEYPLNIEDAGAYNVEELKVYGNSEQDTRSGKNLLYNSNKGTTGWDWVYQTSLGGNATLETFENTGIHINISEPPAGWQYTRLLIREEDILKLNPNTKYTLSFDYKTNTSHSSVTIKISWPNQTNILTDVVKTSIIHDNEWHKSTTILTTNDLTNLKNNQMLHIQGIDTIGDFYIKNIQLEEGYTATDYELYGAMPSPDYPSEVRNVEPIQIEGKDGYWLKGKITGKNLLSPKDFNETKTINGVTFTNNNDGTWNIHGTASQDINIQLYKREKIKEIVKSNTSYSFYCNFPYNANTFNINIHPTYTTETTHWMVIRYASTTKNDTIKSCDFNFHCVAGTELNYDNVELMLTESNKYDNQYEPYKVKEFLCNMDKYDDEGNIIDYHELSKINETKDDLEFISGVLNKKIGRIVLTGDENWEYQEIVDGTERKYFRCPTYQYTQGLPKIIDAYHNNCCCTHYKIITTNWTNFLNDTTENQIFPLQQNGYKICIRSLNCSSVDEFKSYLKDQYNAGTPVTIYYELETPEQYQLESINVELFEGYNRITLEDKYGIVEEAEMTYLTNSKFNEYTQTINKVSSVMTAYITSDKTVTPDADLYNGQVTPFDAEMHTGLFKASNLNDGYIIIPDGVTRVKISGQVVIRSSYNGLFGAVITNATQNQKPISETFNEINVSSTDKYMTYTIAPRIVDVNAGDKIKLNVYFNNYSTAVTARAYGGAATYLTVECIK